MFQTLTWTNAALCLILLTSQPVWADCNSLLEDAKAVARNIAVTIEAPVTSPAATPLKITWIKRIGERSEVAAVRRSDGSA